MIYSILRIVKYLGRKVESCLNLSIQKHSIKIENLPESHFYKDDSFFCSLVSIYKYFLKPSGWLESKARNQSSRNGFAIPWITYSSFEIIDRMQLHKLTIVEFGAGASTHYFSSKALKIISYEFDSDYLVTLEKVTKLVNESFRTVELDEGSTPSGSTTTGHLPRFFMHDIYLKFLHNLFLS